MRFTRGPRPQEHDPKEGSLTRSCEKTKRPREKLERVKGIEPSYSAWKAAALPLSYTREPGVSPASGPAHAWRFAWRQSYKTSPRSVKAACARFQRLPLEGNLQRRNLAAGRCLSPHGPWRCRDADVDVARRPLSRPYWPPRKTAPQASSCSRSMRCSWRPPSGSIISPRKSRDLHIAFGLAMPLLFLAHIKTGRKRA